MLWSTTPKQLLKAVELAAEAYDEMACPLFAEEWQLVQQAAALVKQCQPQLQQYRISLFD